MENSQATSTATRDSETASHKIDELPVIEEKPFVEYKIEKLPISTVKPISSKLSAMMDKKTQRDNPLAKAYAGFVITD